MKYICSTCEDIIFKQEGVENISDEHRMKKAKKETVTDDEEPSKIEEIDDEEEGEEEDLEDDDVFAEAMKGSTRTGSSKETSNTAKKDESLARKKGETKKDEICKYYRRGICRHGLSGNKEVEGKICTRIHPKVCAKFFKHGFHKIRGCNGKASGCQEFHPSICLDLLKGECIGRECTKGFHLYSLRKRARQYREDGDRRPYDERDRNNKQYNEDYERRSGDERDIRERDHREKEGIAHTE